MNLEANALQRCDAILLWFRGNNTAQIAKALNAKESAVANSLAHIFDRCYAKKITREQIREIAGQIKAGLMPADAVL